MAWEWLAPAAAVAGATVGGGTSWLVARGGRKHAEQIARQERQQKRLADAYVDALTIVAKAGHWAGLVPRTTEPGDQARLPTIDEQIRAQALVQAYGSRVVNDLLNAYFTLVRRINKADKLIKDRMFFEGAARRPGYDQLVADLEVNLRPKEHAKRNELVARIAHELDS